MIQKLKHQAKDIAMMYLDGFFDMTTLDNTVLVMALMLMVPMMHREPATVRV